MKTASLVCIVILGGMCLGWLFHGRSVRQMKPILRQLAAEVNGVVKSEFPFAMPKLLFSYSGVNVEVSSASTGIDGESVRYTYVLFKRLATRNFEFRILPRSLQSVVEEQTGFAKRRATRFAELKKHLVISASDKRLMETVLSERIQADLLFWAGRQRENRISDIRNYDDKLLYAVTGDLNDYEEFRLLIDSACRFFDAIDHLVSDSS